jgi:metacaspase-1
MVDDDFKTVFSTLPAGVHLKMFLDSCHSGSGTREAMGTRHSL